jgi:5-methylcytosine-specific restriction endonuclease McrA
MLGVTEGALLLTPDPKPPKRIRDPAAIRRYRLSMRGEPCEDCELRTGIHAHHKVFRSQGGSDTAEGLTWLCGACHDARHGITSHWPDG